MSSCPICVEPITCYAYGSCGHHTCFKCTLRLRALYKNNHCTYCKTLLDSVIFSTRLNDDQPKRMDKKLGIYFTSEDIQSTALGYLRFKCPACLVTCHGWDDLKNHVRKAHKQYLCQICITSKKVFAQEHKLYDSNALQKHLTTGDEDDPSFKGHPECEFCKTRFYGIDELFDHLHKHHENCFLCARNGKPNQYFENYGTLEKHFFDDHYACRHFECLEKKFVVFNSEIDLQAHELKEHGSKRDKNKGRLIQMEFQTVRRATPSNTHNYLEDTVHSLVPPPSFGSNFSGINPSDFPSLSASLSMSRISSQDPTPAETQNGPAASVALSDTFTCRDIEKLLGRDRNLITQFNVVTAQFQNNELSAGDYLDHFVSMAVAAKSMKTDARILQEAGKLWMKMSNFLPEECKVDDEIKQAIEKNKKKKKKGISLAEFESLSSGSTIKDAMLLAWNNLKINAKQSENIAPFIASRYSEAAGFVAVTQGPPIRPKPVVSKSDKPSVSDQDFPSLPVSERKPIKTKKSHQLPSTSRNTWGSAEYEPPSQQPESSGSKKKNQKSVLVKWG